MIKYSLGFLFNKTGSHVALILKEKPEWQRGRCNGIGGKIEDGETPLDAMNREFLEEAGVDGLEWVHNITLTEPSTYELHIFSCHDDHVYDVMTMEKEVVGIFETSKLPNVIPNIHWIIPFIQDNSIQFPITMTIT